MRYRTSPSLSFSSIPDGIGRVIEHGTFIGVSVSQTAIAQTARYMSQVR